jgi:cell division septum initiation protein DivIVA
MMTRRERAEKLRDSMYHRNSVDAEIDLIEKCLREAVEEAVQADRKLGRENNEALAEAIKRGTDSATSCTPTAEDIQARTAQAVHRPTAEDALKAIHRLICSQTCRDNEECSRMRKIMIGVEDLLAGKRSTLAAKAIIGDEPTAKTVKP